MFAVSLAVLSHAFPRTAERVKALAAYGATMGGSFAVGPLVGGASRVTQPTAVGDRGGPPPRSRRHDRRKRSCGSSSSTSMPVPRNDRWSATAPASHSGVT